MTKARATARRYRMWAAGEKIVVGVSGGPDSVALLHVLRRLSAEDDLSLVVAHLHHGLRGRDADEDEDFVRSLAAAWSLPFVSFRESVRDRARRGGLSLQAAAREARYEFFRQVARAEAAGRIALAHHADDQAETVLFRLLRGAGPRGLAGIPPVRGMIIRPLIEVGRDEILAYCREQGLAYRHDPSNVDPKYRRNRIRHELLPYLEEHYNPRVREALIRLAAILREDESFLESSALQLYRTVAQEVTFRDEEAAVRVALPRAELAKMHPSMRRRVLRHALARLRVPGNAVDWALSERLMKAADEGDEAGIDLPGGVRLTTNDVELCLERPPEMGGDTGSATAAPFELEVEVPGSYWLSGGAWLVRLRRDRAAEHFRQRFADLSDAAFESDGEKGGVFTDGGEWEAVLDWDQLRPPLKLRSRRPGDRFQPLGLEGTKKVQDLLVDAKVPRSERDRVPLLVDEEGIVCVVGLRIAHRARVRPSTEEVLVVRARFSGTSFQARHEVSEHVDDEDGELGPLGPGW